MISVSVRVLTNGPLHPTPLPPWGVGGMHHEMAQLQMPLPPLSPLSSSSFSFCHPRRLSPTPVLDVSNRGSNRESRQGRDPSFCFLSFSCLHTRAIPWRHLMAPAGVAAPQSRNLVGGEDCLSEASSAALTFGTGAKAPGGPRPGANGFGSFCRNKRTSSCGAETPQAPPLLQL